MTSIDRDAPVRFIRTAFDTGDSIGVLLKMHIAPDGWCNGLCPPQQLPATAFKPGCATRMHKAGMCTPSA